MHGFRSTLTLIVWLLEQVKDALEALAQRRRQQAYDDLQNDPAGWFDAHFNGVPDHAGEATETKAGKPEADA